MAHSIISRTIVALALSAAVPIASTIAVAGPATASDRVITFPIDGQVLLAPSVLTTSSETGLVIWQTGQFATGSNQVVAAEPIQLRRRVGDTWHSSTLPTTGMAPVSYYFGRLILEENPANGQILAAAHTDTGAWVWVSTDGGTTFAAPRLLEGRWLVPSTLAFDRRGGFYMVEQTGTDLNGVAMAHFDASLSRLPTPDFSSWVVEKWVPQQVDMVGDTPVGYFSNPNSNKPDEHLRVGAGPSSMVINLPPLWNIDVVGTSTVGAIAGLGECDASTFGCAIVHSIIPAGVLGPEVQLSISSSPSEVALTTVPGTVGALRAAYISNRQNVYLAEAANGPDNGWTQWKVFDAQRGGIFQPHGIAVSSGLVGGLGAPVSDTNKGLIWVTDTAPARPSKPRVSGHYARRSGKLSLLLGFEGTISTELVVRVRAGKRTAVRTLTLDAPTAEDLLRPLRTKLSKKFRRLATEPKARMTVRATAIAGPGATASATTRISLRKTKKNERHQHVPAPVSATWSRPNLANH